MKAAFRDKVFQWIHSLKTALNEQRNMYESSEFPNLNEILLEKKGKNGIFSQMPANFGLMMIVGSSFTMLKPNIEKKWDGRKHATVSFN